MLLVWVFLLSEYSSKRVLGRGMVIFSDHTEPEILFQSKVSINCVMCAAS